MMDVEKEHVIRVVEDARRTKASTAPRSGLDFGRRRSRPYGKAWDQTPGAAMRTASTTHF